MAREPAGRFCWLDLAATDAPRAIEFYAGLFGWNAREQRANGGRFVRLAHGGHDVGSLYPLSESALAKGAHSHWTPYVRVRDVAESCALARRLGGSVPVESFEVDAIARIALVVDPGGAPFGLWEDLP
jgi:predicted enzyme related to lactoylglutathione lyase